MQTENNQQPSLQAKTKTIDIEKVSEKVDIVSLALEYGLDLIQQTNGEYICVCPFHEDINPSMRIYPQSNSFYCFGCQAGSSIFEFVMQMENIEFKDALYRLAERVGHISTFVLRDIEIHQLDESFIVHRNKIENALHSHAKKIYKIAFEGGISKKTIFEYFDTLWQWYDYQQYIFDKKLFEGHNSEKLIVILYRFYEAFLQKLYNLEKNLMRGEINAES